MLPFLFLSRVDPFVTVVDTGFSTDGMFFVGLIRKALVVFFFFVRAALDEGVAGHGESIAEIEHQS